MRFDKTFEMDIQGKDGEWILDASVTVSCIYRNHYPRSIEVLEIYHNETDTNIDFEELTARAQHYIKISATDTLINSYSEYMTYFDNEDYDFASLE